MQSSTRTTLRTIAKAAAAVCLSAALLAPAAAQFWNPFGSSPQRQQRQPQRQQPQSFNPWGNWWGGSSQEQRKPQQRAPVDYSNAPPQARRTPEAAAAITTPIVVMGDGMADWLAYGLEDAFSEKPEFGIVRKHRAYSGLVRYDPRRDVEWPQIAREIITAEKPKFIVMMVGFHDRQAIRERSASPAPARPGAPAPQPSEVDAEFHDPDSPESRAKASAEQQNAEMQKAAQPPAAAQQQPKAAPAGPMEFQSEAWQAAYVGRIDATIAALKSANVPVFWVGLPPQRNPRQAADAIYLNDLYRARAERAGIVFIDIWDGFVDEAGRYVFQGPDVEGQTRRLRSGDGIYFTRAGARKLAHYVEREILRSLIGRETPIALPAPEPAVPAKPGTTVRPLAGPVIPLTASIGGGKELLGGGTARPGGTDPLATRVLVRGEAINAPAGRADNFAWPRGSANAIPEAEPEPAVQPVPSGRTAPQPQPPAQSARPQPSQPPASAAAPARVKSPPPAEARPPVQRHIPPRASNDGAPRPPLPINPR